MPRPWWDSYVDGETLTCVLERLAVAKIAIEDWTAVRSALVGAWPRQDVGDSGEECRPAEVAPVEADVDVREM